MTIRSLAAMLQSGLGSRLFDWVRRGIPFPSVTRMAAGLGYRVGRNLLLSGWRLVRGAVSAADALGQLRGQQQLPRSGWPVLRSIPRAYQVWARIRYQPAGDGPEVVRRQIIDFDRNPTVAEITSVLRREARRRVERGTDPQLQQGVDRVTITIEAAFRRTT